MKRKNFSAILILFFLALTALIIGAYSATFRRGGVAASADGGSYAVREISSAEELAAMAKDVNDGLYDGYYGITFVMTEDISLKAVGGWTPAGTSLYPFKGTFDGNGFTVSDLTVETYAARAGLFGVAGRNAVVKNLTVCGSVAGESYTGGIAGENGGLIENCTARVYVSAENESLHIGGIAGFNTGVISRSQSLGEVNAAFSTFTGGIAGSNSGTVEKCFSAAPVASAGPVAGGVAGNNSVGGKIEICYNTAVVSAKSAAGGIAGNNQGDIANAFNRGQVISVDGTAGGIAGSTEVSGTLYYCLSACAVSGAEETAAVCGYNLGVTADCVYDGAANGQNAVNGIAAENTVSLPARLSAHSDALANGGKAGCLAGGAWTKRADKNAACYPELTYFYENFPENSLKDFSIERINLSAEDITLSRESFVYNAESHTVDFYYGGILLENGEDFSAEYTDNVNAGTVEISIDLLRGFCGSCTKTFVIEKSVLQTEWDETEFVYDGSPHMPKLLVCGGAAAGESVAFSYTDAICTAAGAYAVKATLADTPVNSNYFLPEAEINFEITRAPITVGWTEEEFIYNGAVQLPKAYVASGRIGAEEITLRYEYADGVNAGAQRVTAFLADTETNSNYCFAGEEHAYLIGKRRVTVLWEESCFVYNGKAQYPQACVCGGAVDGESVTLAYCGYENNIAANEAEGWFVYAVLADTEVNKNYYLPEEKHGYFICKAPLTLGWWDTPLTYNGAPQYPAFYVDGGRIGADEINFNLSDYSGNVAASVGEVYSVEVTLADDAVGANYSLPVTVRRYAIYKADFNPVNTVAFGAQTFAYDGSVKTLTVTGALPAGVSVEYINNAHTEVGEYVATARFFVDAANYNAPATDCLTAQMYIAPMIFEDAESGVKAVNLGNADYALSLGVTGLDGSSLTKKGKKRIAAYGVSFGDSAAEYSVALGVKQLNKKGLCVLCKNSRGEVFAAEFTVADGRLVFSADGVEEFAVFADRNFIPLYACLCADAAVIFAGAALLAILLRRKNARPAAAPATAAYKETVCAEQTAAAPVPAEEKLKENKIAKPQIKANTKADFTLDGTYCKSYDWFLKSLHFKKQLKQKQICGGDKEALKLVEMLPGDKVYWQGRAYKTGSAAYKKLLERAAAATNEKN